MDDNATFPLNKYQSLSQYYDLNQTPWAMNEETEKPRKIYDATIPIYNVPFCKRSITTTTVDLIEKNENKIVVEF